MFSVVCMEHRFSLCFVFLILGKNALLCFENPINMNLQNYEVYVV